MKLPKEIWMCENEQARWFEFEQPYDLPNDVTVIKMVPQRTWVGLTPQERDEINEQVYGAVPHHVAFHHAIEAKLKEKNNG